MEARRGSEAYRKGDWVESAEHFRRAEAGTPDPVLRYNLGAAAYQGQNYPEAVEAFGAGSPSERVSANRIAYNLGNASYKSGNLEGALDAYRRALREDPDDEDARFNYELVLEQMQSQASDQNQQQPQDQEKDSSENPGSNSQTSPPDSSGRSQDASPPKDEEQPQEEEQQQAQGEESEKQDASKKAGDVPPGEETQEQFLEPEDAVRLLDAVTPEERELIRARLRSSSRKRVEKDW
jgi:tetratricopeptide (TPR) repeat protein